MKEDELNKYRCAIRMITDGFIEDYADVDLNAITFRLKDVTMIVTGLGIISVQNSLFCY